MNSTYNYAPGALHFDIHHNNISMSATQIADLVRSLRAEDVQPIQEEKPQKTFFSRITQAAYDKGMAQAVEDELRCASISAPKLVKSIRTNEALGYLDTQNMSSRDLFNLLNDHFGLPFKERCFMNYRSN